MLVVIGAVHLYSDPIYTHLVAVIKREDGHGLVLIDDLRRWTSGSIFAISRGVSVVVRYISKIPGEGLVAVKYLDEAARVLGTMVSQYDEGERHFKTAASRVCTRTSDHIATR